MDVLNSRHAPLDATRSRRATMLASAVAHGSVIVAIVIAAYNQVLVIRPHEAKALTFVALEPLPVPRPAVPPKPLRLPPIVKEELKVAELPRSVEAPPIAEVRPKPTPVTPRREDPAPVERPKAPAIVTVGAFALIGNSAHAPEINRPVQAAGFDAPEAHSANVIAATANVGAFEQATAGPARPGTDRSNTFGDAGFGSAVATGRARSGGQVAEAGFGGSVVTGSARRAGNAVASGSFETSPPTVRPSTTPGSIKTADFDARPVQAAAAQTARPVVTEVPLEILSKPTPAYTDEARKLQIEGDVVLEVEFTATGEIHVVRVVRGLGHGLDESAQRAVQGMRFKPAQRNGESIDVHTTISIVFRLA